MPGIHLSGIASGLDTQSVINQLLALESAKITALQNRRQELQNDVSAWSDVNGTLGTLAAALDTLRHADTWSALTVTVSASDKLSATASAGAEETTYRVAILQLAQAHTVASNRLSSTTDPLVNIVEGLSAGDSFTLEGEAFVIEAEDTLLTLRDRINETVGDQVRASVVDNRLVWTRQETGATEIAVEDGEGTPLADLGIWDGSAFLNELATAQDALFTVNGLAVTRSANSGLTDVISGVTLNLLAETASDETVTLTVGRDVASIQAAIHAFITAYNNATGKLQSYSAVDLSDPKNPQAAILHGETLVPNILTSLRRLAVGTRSPYLNEENAAYTWQGRSGVMDSLDDIGLGTLGRENTLAVTDSARLDYMLEHYFDKVEQLFRGVVGESGYEHGVAEDLYQYVNRLTASTTGEVANRMATLQTTIRRYDDVIARMTDALEEREQQLWKQFAAMEQAIAALQSQLSWLSAQISLQPTSNT